MYSAKKLTDILFCFYPCTLAVILIFTVSTVRAEMLTVSGKFVKGSCSVIAPEQTVLFPGGIEIQQLKSDPSDTTYTAPFTFKYRCSEFDVSSSPQSVVISITPVNGSVVNSDNKIYPSKNTQNAGFILRNCDNTKQNCHLVTFAPSGKVPFIVTMNGEMESYFEASVVKLTDQQAKAGELVASVDMTLLQP